jgi:hypothetical protein
VSDRSQQFVEVYTRARVEDQRDYYRRRAEDFQRSHRQLLLISSIVFGLSGAAGLVAGLDVPGKLIWAIVAAVLPAITTAIAAYDGLYAFERLTKLYTDAARNLRLVEAPKLADSPGDRATIANFVVQVEEIFKRERGQWGQLEVGAQQREAGEKQ